MIKSTKLLKNFLVIFCASSICMLVFSSSVQAQTFAKGADVSWLDQMEASGYKFYNNSGTQQDLFTILKGKGMNSIRLRVWVNPSGGWCNKADMLWMAKRAKAAGMRIMLDIHYSDTWADPGHQTKPAAWKNYNFTALMKAVYDHTLDLMNTLKSNGITPEWVQVGNETNNGMLWEDGKASVNMKNFAWLFNSGYNAVKAVSSSSKVIIHLSNANDNALYRWLLDGIKANGSKWDAIGMSVYPTTSNWASNNTAAYNTMKDVTARYGTPVIISETGMEVTAAATCESFLTDLINKVKSLGSKGLGVFYWEPQCYNNWAGYGKGAFGSDGRPTRALNAFLNTSAREISFEEPISNSLNNETFKTFPNPYTNELNIEYKLEKDEVVHIDLLDGVGKLQKVLLNPEKQSKGIHTLVVNPGSDSRPGIYLVKITHGNKSLVRKVNRI